MNLDTGVPGFAPVMGQRFAIPGQQRLDEGALNRFGARLVDRGALERAGYLACGTGLSVVEMILKRSVTSLWTGVFSDLDGLGGPFGRV